MSKSQRTKGAVFERDVCKIFSDHFGRDFKRNIGQARDGGNDIDVGPLVVECKRRASLKVLRQWMQQAAQAAHKRSVGVYPRLHVPVVVMREDNGPEPMVLLGMRDFLDLTGGAILGRMG